MEGGEEMGACSMGGFANIMQLSCKCFVINVLGICAWRNFRKVNIV